MTLMHLLGIISPENQDSIMYITDYADNIMAESSVYDILHDFPIFSFQSNNKAKVLTSLEFLYSIQSTLDFEIEEKSLKVRTIQYVESEENEIETRMSYIIPHKRMKPIIGYSIRFNDIRNIQELNWACWCAERGYKYNRDDIHTWDCRLDYTLRNGGFI